MVLVVQQAITFTVFGFLQPLSYLFFGIVMLSFIFMVFLFIRSPFVSLFEITSFVFFFILVTNSLIGAADVKNSFYQLCIIGLMLLLFNYYQNRVQLLIKSMAFAFSCCVYLNMLIMVLFPNWMFMAEDTFDSFLLGGNYNQMGPRFLAAIVLNSLCIEYNWKWRINYIALIVVATATLVLVNSMTSFAAIILYVFISLIPSLKLRKYAAVSIFIFFVLFQLFVVFRGTSLHNNEMAVYIIEDLLGKDITFTHRTDMWEQSLDYFFKSPFIGYGLLDGDWYKEHMVVYGLGPHNFILAIMLYGGVPLLALYLTIVFFAFRSLSACYDSNSIKVALGTATLFVMTLMEQYPFFFVFLFLTIAYHYSELQPSYEKPEEDDE